MVQKLEPDDYTSRLKFANSVLQKIDGEDPTFLKRVVFSDEAAFHLSGKVNRHNCRIWGVENPHEVREHERASPKVNVWCAISYDRIYGPFFFAEKTVKGANYLDMLQQYFFPQVHGRRLIFQQDGAPPHFANAVRDCLNERFPHGWIGRGGPVSWPPRSPDLTSPDFFLWGHLKTLVYAQKVSTIQELREKITEAIASISKRTLEAVFEETEKRLRAVVVGSGGHIEV
jgi:hypothetical protein